MTLCPVALAVGCKKCPIFSVCPAKGLIGDYQGEGSQAGESDRQSNEPGDKSG
ncbi:MAG: hypothetical protein DHS20C11_10450 [Lysobacteraceae bacterium]|nr:MAG: hypothetical protein DHS20C11_10450 [Xanthomonadaceae bacterium]